MNDDHTPHMMQMQQLQGSGTPLKDADASSYRAVPPSTARENFASCRTSSTNKLTAFSTWRRR